MNYNTENILENLRISFSEKWRGTSNNIWQYPIKYHFDKPYDYHTAQKLLEFSYKVPVHNKQVEEGIPNPVKLNPPFFKVIIPLNTTVRSLPANVLWFFYSKKLNMVVLSFTGTYNDATWLVDFDYFQEDLQQSDNIYSTL